MTILAIDTSSRSEMAIVETTAEGTMLWQITTQTPCAGDAMQEALEELQAHGLTSITALVVTTGPGSYTGIRVGCAVAAGISAVQHLPIYPIDSLQVAISLNAEDTHNVWAVRTAGRGAWYACQYTCAHGVMPVEAPIRCSADAAAFGEDDVWTCEQEIAHIARASWHIPRLGDALAAVVPKALSRTPITASTFPLTYGAPDAKPHAVEVIG